MIFLPIVQRELRVSARKRSTYWVRVIAAGVAIIVGACFLLLMRVTPAGMTGPGSGSGLFTALTWLTLLGALSSGIFLTSDCLSEEKREGTMGLLFLTDLRGHDVVLGKLLATSLRAGCAMLGVFPVLAITLLMGGVSAYQFWRTCLALTGALLISLAAGIFVSAMSRLSQKALAATLSLLLVLAAAGPLGDCLIAWADSAAFKPVLSHSSPVYLFMMATASMISPRFWTAFAVNASIAGALLGVAFVLLPRSWQQKNAAQAFARGSWMRWWKFGGAGRELGRRRLMELNPVMWLACRERWQASALWCLALLQATACGAVLYIAEMPAWMIWSYITGFLSLLVYLGLASHAGRFFVEARHSGLTELMLATPLSAREIVGGQWRALLRLFGLPLALVLVTQLVGGVLTQHVMWEQMSAAVTADSGIPGFSAFGLACMLAGAGALVVVADLVAIAWFGMWMGVTSRSVNQATLKTILYVQILPWFVISFAAGMIIPLLLIPAMMSGAASQPNRFMLWFPLLSTGLGVVLNLATDTWFVVWARRKLYGELRERVGTKVWAPRPASS